MIVLDTNVLSEAIRPVPSRRVLDWLAAQQPSGLFTTAISEAELFYGLALLPAGKRRTSLEEAVRRMLEEDLAQRVLPFDRAPASAFAVIASGRRQRAGRLCGNTDPAVCERRGQPAGPVPRGHLGRGGVATPRHRGSARQACGGIHRRARILRDRLGRPDGKPRLACRPSPLGL